MRVAVHSAKRMAQGVEPNLKHKTPNTKYENQSAPLIEYFRVVKCGVVLGYEHKVSNFQFQVRGHPVAVINPFSDAEPA